MLGTSSARMPTLKCVICLGSKPQSKVAKCGACVDGVVCYDCASRCDVAFCACPSADCNQYGMDCPVCRARMGFSANAAGVSKAMLLRMARTVFTAAVAQCKQLTARVEELEAELEEVEADTPEILPPYSEAAKQCSRAGLLQAVRELVAFDQAQGHGGVDVMFRRLPVPAAGRASGWVEDAMAAFTRDGFDVHRFGVDNPDCPFAVHWQRGGATHWPAPDWSDEVERAIEFLHRVGRL